MFNTTLVRLSVENRLKINRIFVLVLIFSYYDGRNDFNVR